MNIYDSNLTKSLGWITTYREVIAITKYVCKTYEIFDSIKVLILLRALGSRNKVSFTHVLLTIVESLISNLSVLEW